MLSRTRPRQNIGGGGKSKSKGLNPLSRPKVKLDMMLAISMSMNSLHQDVIPSRVFIKSSERLMNADLLVFH